MLQQLTFPKVVLNAFNTTEKSMPIIINYYKVLYFLIHILQVEFKIPLLVLKAESICTADRLVR